MFFEQDGFEIRCEWASEGLKNIYQKCRALVIVDVLSFCTAVDIGVSRGAIIYPYRYKDASAADYARSLAAVLANSDRAKTTEFSLSPRSLLNIPAGTRLVLPSPNGSSLAFSAQHIPTFAGCLRNARAVAVAAQSLGNPIGVIAAGEHWDNGTLRPAAEDFIGAGAIIHYLKGSRSPEAELASACFERVQGRLLDFLQNCASGRELIERGCIDDLNLAGVLNQSCSVPILENGAFVCLDPAAS